MKEIPGGKGEMDAGKAWSIYVKSTWRMNDAMVSLADLPESVLRESGKINYKHLFFFLASGAPSEVRLIFLDELLGELFADTPFSISSIATVASLSADTVRGRLSSIAVRLLYADADDRRWLPLHVLWVYREFTAVRAILDTWIEKQETDPSGWWDEGDFVEFAEDHPMPGAWDSGADAWRESALNTVLGPDPSRYWSTPQVKSGAVLNAQLLWEELGEEDRISAAAVRRVGRDVVLRKSLSVSSPAECVVRLLATWFCSESGMSIAASIIGDAFYGAYFSLLIRKTETDAAAAVWLLPILRHMAQGVGRDDLVRQAVDVERSIYGAFDDHGLIVEIRE